MKTVFTLGRIFKWFPLLPVVLGLCPFAISAENAAGNHPAAAYRGVLLQKIIGGIAKLKPLDKVEDCKIATDNDQIKGRLNALGPLIDAASSKDFNTAFHFMAQVPSIEIFATRVFLKGGAVQTEKVLLLQDYETLKTRNGKEAQELIALVNKLCPTPPPP